MQSSGSALTLPFCGAGIHSPLRRLWLHVCERVHSGHPPVEADPSCTIVLFLTALETSTKMLMTLLSSSRPQQIFGYEGSLQVCGRGICPGGWSCGEGSTVPCATDKGFWLGWEGKINESCYIMWALGRALQCVQVSRPLANILACYEPFQREYFFGWD